jgi:BirA family biotin operon repressor/biotin-[acetyl-CoA-carboxylase] ligase
LYKTPAKTLFLGKNIVFVPDCHSTNSFALNLCHDSSIHDGTVVITDCQTAGRGQRGNTWEAEPGKNLTFSIIIKPIFLSVREQFYLNIFTSLAVYDLLRDKTNAAISIKWPNDVLVDAKKISGILIENHIQGHQVSQSVIGIGLNVNQVNFSVNTATSFREIVNHDQDLSAILEDLLVCIEARYLQLRQQKLSSLKDQYLAAMYWRHEKHVFTSDGNLFEGVIMGIDNDGKLLIERSGKLQAFNIQEIGYVHENQSIS